MALGTISRTIYNAIAGGGDGQGETRDVTVISPLDARSRPVSISEMRLSGKSAARLRVEKGINSPIDFLEVRIEDLISRGGRER